MNRPDDIGSRQGEQVVVAPDVARMVAEALTPKIGLGKAVPLDEGPGRAVEDQDPLFQEGPQEGDALLTRPNWRSRCLGGLGSGRAAGRRGRG